MTDDNVPFRLRQLRSDELSANELAAIRELMDLAFGDDPEGAFEDDDWDHALGGIHVLLDRGTEIIAHASVVERELQVAGRPLRSGYVEAVATAPARQGQGHATGVMTSIGSLIRDRYELGALGTGSHGFYARLGWEAWRGPSSVRTPDGPTATPDDDGFLMVLRTPRTPPIDLNSPITCDWRRGDVW